LLSKLQGKVTDGKMKSTKNHQRRHLEKSKDVHSEMKDKSKLSKELLEELGDKDCFKSKSRKSSKSRSRSKRKSRSRSKGRLGSKSSRRSKSRSSLKSDKGESSPKKIIRKSLKRAKSLSNLDMDGVVNTESSVMAEISALEAELDQKISLFSIQDTPNLNALVEMLDKSNYDSDTRTCKNLRKSVPALDTARSKSRGRQSRKGLRRSQSKSNIHLLEGDEEESKANIISKGEYGSLDDLQKLATRRNTMPEAPFALWDNSQPESHIDSSIKPRSLSALIKGQKGDSEESSRATSGTVSTSKEGEEEKLSSWPSPMKMSNRRSTFGRIMSYSSMKDDLVDDVQRTPRSRSKPRLSGLVSTKSINPPSFMDDEAFLIGDIDTPRTRRKKLGRLSTLFK